MEESHSSPSDLSSCLISSSAHIRHANAAIVTEQSESSPHSLAPSEQRGEKWPSNERRPRSPLRNNQRLFAEIPASRRSARRLCGLQLMFALQPLCITQTFNKRHHPICERNAAQCGPQLALNDTANCKIGVERGTDNSLRNRLKAIHQEGPLVSSSRRFSLGVQTPCCSPCCGSPRRHWSS